MNVQTSKRRLDRREEAAYVAHLVGLERRLPVHARVAARFKQPVPFPQGHLQCFPDRQQGLPARLRAARFDEAQMAGGQSRPMGQIELADTARRAPRPQDTSQRRGVTLTGVGACPHGAMVMARRRG